MRLNETAKTGHCQMPHRIGHEHEAVFQHSNAAARLTAKIFGDLLGQFFHPPLDLLGGEQDLTFLNASGSIQWDALGPDFTRNSCFLTASFASFAAVTSSSMRPGPSPDLSRNLAPGAKPGIQMISLPLVTTGHTLRSAAGIFCSSSFTFFGARVCAGWKRSPDRQFRTVNSPAISEPSMRLFDDEFSPCRRARSILPRDGMTIST